MKKTLILSALAAATFLSSCKKDEDKAVVPSILTVVASDSSVSSDHTEVKTYSYNANKKVVKVLIKYITSSYTSESYDTIYYNSDGKVSKVENRGVYSGEVFINRTQELTYTGGNLSMMIDSYSNWRKSASSSNSDTTKYSYVNGKLFKVDMGEGEVIDSITFVSNNIASAVYQGMKIIVTSDLTAPNPYVNTMYSPQDFLSFANANNVLKAYAELKPEVPLENNSYTYSNGKVLTKTENSEEGNKTIHFKYKDL